MVNEKIAVAQRQAQDIALSIEIIYHEKSGKSTDQAVEALGATANMVIKSLVLYASKEDVFVGFIILGTNQLDIKKACRAAGVKKLRFASPEQIGALTGFDIGGVPPTALQRCSALFLDSKVIEQKFVIGAGGDEHCGMKFSPKQFLEKTEAGLSDVTK